ncbi:chorismate mutase family protein [Variovorax sp. VNK109]|uniref:chorismate mutase family protein n=1 Tax=Variovorax sp. VNK109 TaxID=3400919 RepID=UPI003C0CDAE8
MSEDLQQLRARLDAIDVQLLAVLKARLDCCEDIGRYKKRHDVAMMQPQRIGIVKARAGEFARTNGMSEAFLSDLYDVIIAETCRLEDIIIHG